jgi:uncharacterized membrane protein (UPF0127 family)
MTFIARNVETGFVVADRISLASRRIDRAVGLLGRRGLEPGEGLLITPCHGVHTCFMRFCIDVLALDQNGVVVDAVSTMKPWRIRFPRKDGHSVLELPAGRLEEAQTKLGDRISLETGR